MKQLTQEGRRRRPLLPSLHMVSFKHQTLEAPSPLSFQDESSGSWTFLRRCASEPATPHMQVLDSVERWVEALWSVCGTQGADQTWALAPPGVPHPQGTGACLLLFTKRVV